MRSGAYAAEAHVLRDDPDDVETANRLGKALAELDDFASAADAYERPLAVDATNVIARKNLARSGEHGEAAVYGQPGNPTDKIDGDEPEEEEEA